MRTYYDALTQRAGRMSHPLRRMLSEAGKVAVDLPGIDFSEDVMNTTHTGSCLCGAVRFRTRGALRGVVYCHCSQCRRQSGHFVASTNSKDDDIVIEGQEAIKWYEASDVARRGFCGTCGSLLFWKHNDLDSISIMAGSFDQPSGLIGETHIFVGDKGDYYKIEDGLPQFRKSTSSIKVAQD